MARRTATGPDRRAVADDNWMNYLLLMRYLLWLAVPLGALVTNAQMMGLPGTGGAVIPRVYMAPGFGQNQFGAMGGGYGGGGISYVTRRTPMMNANLLAGEFFRTAGVPLTNNGAAALNGTLAPMAQLAAKPAPPAAVPAATPMVWGPPLPRNTLAAAPASTNQPAGTVVSPANAAVAQNPAACPIPRPVAPGKPPVAIAPAGRLMAWRLNR
jgi:hypothetical protein